MGVERNLTVDLSVACSLPALEIRCHEIRCQFIIFARKDEPTSRQESSGKLGKGG